MTYLLGIESSCDETGIAVVENGTRILVNEVASQIDLHAVFGGVVPEIASRQHIKVIAQMVRHAIEVSGKEMDAIAVTNGPGLMGSLMVGVNFAKALAYAWRVPIVPVHHIEGHIFSTFLDATPPEFPFLALIVSGGHTQLITCRTPHDYEILGTTRDDAVGECFDKVARLLELPYPGGPSIQQAAVDGDPKAVDFPRPMIHAKNFDFSYSGLKTAVLYALRENPSLKRADVAASFQAAAVDVLVAKTQRAIAETSPNCLVVAGGVAANKRLRDQLNKTIGIPIHLPEMALCVDNGAMIAAAGFFRLEQGLVGDLHTTPNPGLSLEHFK